nr:SCP2 sterol-binding domain-containing protein [Candidatus Freyarchaeota archaeon]
MPKWCTVEWFEELKKHWLEDEEAQKLLKGVTTIHTYRVVDKPDITPISFSIVDGKPGEIDLAKPEFVGDYNFEATWENWKKLLQGEVDPVKTIMSGRIKLKGHLLSLLKRLKGFLRLLSLLKSVKTEW